jgi:signal transduction histidine kinase
MKRFRASLSVRLIVWFVLVQSGVSVLGMGVSLFLQRQPGDEYAFAQMHLNAVVADALVDGPDGRPMIADTPELRAFKARRPGVGVAALDGAHVLRGSSASLGEALRGPHVLRGSSPSLGAALVELGTPRFLNASFVLTRGSLAGSTIVATSVPSRWGPITVVGADNLLRPDDVPALVLYMGRYLVQVMVLVMLGAAVVTPFVIQRALRPLNEASLAAGRIDLRSRDLRLPEGRGVPSELAGLVAAINAALARLDEGVGRQQRIAAEAAHELRTPLAILAARIDSQPESETVLGMRRDLERMRSLVDQLLLIANLEAQNIVLDEPLDLVALARDVVADCTPVALTRGRTLALTPELPQRAIRSSRRILYGALTNLVENAIRAEPDGGVVEVRVCGNGDVLVVDHGAGVAPADRERIFDPFWRRDDHHPGAGLGLAIVKEAATAHGGHVSVEETPGGGATFRFRAVGTRDA